MRPPAAALGVGSGAALTRIHHYGQLDALRGLAACAVALGHYVKLWEPALLSARVRVLLDIVFRPFFNGGSSVLLFFLLSGFVLSLPYKRKKQQPYGIFLLRRFARIYLPYFGALVLALIAELQFSHPIVVSEWFSKTWSEPLSWQLIRQHLWMIGCYDSAQINTAFWSLAVEMRLSILFPLLCIPVLRWRRWPVFVIVSALPVLIFAVNRVFLHRLDPVYFGNVMNTLVGALAFAGGILLVRFLEPIRELWRKLGFVQRYLALVVSLALLEWSDLLAMHVFHIWILSAILPLVGCYGLLAVALCSWRLGLVLNHRLPAWLGRVSYSLYLVHATVLFSLVHLFLGRFTKLQLLLPYLMGSLLLAALFFALVEKPSIGLSRRIGQRNRVSSTEPVAIGA